MSAKRISRWVYIQHPELGKIEVNVEGVIGAHTDTLDDMKIYYRSYDVTNDLRVEEQLEALNQVLAKGNL